MEETFRKNGRISHYITSIYIYPKPDGKRDKNDLEYELKKKKKKKVHILP
jgi:hypothetical protein